ncbi:carbohydrate kinase [Aquamicrobium sp. LC103]|uniref:carbohydrate kinase family protein n=1 Tax=Aquamicrobium sp. LC103 TaxID=1120658 RepID=UPI00063EBA4C|nr:carbohydrate kinase [Aquamicrobium sp. LC103]TKT81184.1 carbohydrate kinase [Aquamicrobium sp. LC103]
MILCCGEALIDMLPRETTVGERAFAPYVGGAVFNTAIALGRLGAPVAFFSGISTDLFGKQLTDALTQSNVDLRHVSYSARPTTLAFVHLNDGHAAYTFYDENSAGRMLTEADLPDIGTEVEALHFSCISLVSEPCGSAYEALMRREHGSRVTMLDPNIRAAFITDKEAHRRRMLRMIAMADIVKLSDEDLVWFDETGSQDEIAERWLAMGPKLLVLTRGSQGATGYTKHGSVRVSAPSVAVADTVGAGDTFSAGLLSSLHQTGLITKSAIAALCEGDLRTALEFAVRVAAVTVSRAGANPPWKHELG